MKSFTIFNRFLTLTLATAALLTASCKKEAANNPSQPTPQLIKIQEVNGSSTLFDYNASGQVIKMSATEDGQQEVVHITYQNNKPATATSQSGTVKFTYADNKLDLAELFAGDTGGASFGHIKLNYTAGTLANMVVYHNLNGNAVATPVVKTEYEYYANGDIKKQIDYGWNPYQQKFALSQTTEYEYDDHVNPLATLGDVYHISFQLTSRHNPVSETVTDETGAIVYSIQYIYNYNFNGYPSVVSKRKINAGQQGGPTVSQILYTYK